MLLVALGWWWRRSRWLPGYGIAVAAAAFTHFYGLFVFAAGLALLPAIAWIAYASVYLLSSRSGSWICAPDSALFEDTLARALGPWPDRALTITRPVGVALPAEDCLIPVA